MTPRPAPPPPGSADDALGGHLAELGWLLADRDQTLGRILRLLVSVSNDDELPQRLGGMSLHVWLQHVGRLRGPDARAMLGVVDVAVRLPGVVGGLCDGWLSWSQVQAIASAARRVPVARLAELDALVCAAMLDLANCEPDAIVGDVWQWVDAHQPSRLEREEAARDRDDFLTLMPRLFGGGAVYGEYGPVGFATVAEALDAPLGPPVAVPDDLDHTDAVDDAYAALDDRHSGLARSHGKRLAGRFLELCEESLGRGGGTHTDDRPRPLLLATVELDALLDDDRTPGWLLHTLAGGRCRTAHRTTARLAPPGDLGQGHRRPRSRRDHARPPRRPRPSRPVA